MTRWVRSGSSQKHKKMPGDATKWGEFDNQYARKNLPPKKKNVKSQSGLKQEFQSSDSHSSKHEESFDDFFDEGKYCFTRNSISTQESGATGVTLSDVMSSSITNEADSSNFTTKETNRKMKKQKNFNDRHSSFDEKNCGINSNEVLNTCKKIKLKINPSSITEEKEILKQSGNLKDFAEGEKNIEESFSQEPNKKKKKKKKYNEVNSQSLIISEKTEEISVSNNITFGNSDETSNAEQDVECMDILHKIREPSKSSQITDRSLKKQKLKKQDKIDKNSNLSLMKNESGKNSSSKVFENRKEKHLKMLQKKREKLGLLLLPRNVECKLQKIKKRLMEKGFPPEKQKEIMRQTRRKEELKYRKVFNPSKLCFGCREPGHILADCPKKAETLKQETGICFKCGSVEHTSFKCPEKVKGFPYAKCFICKEQGHISRDCPQNKHGVYPKGGRCKLCGNVNHLKKDCPSLKKRENEEENVTLHTFGEDASVDADIVKKEEIKTKHAKKAKIVKF